MSICLFYVSVCLFVCLFVCLCLSLSVSVCLSLCLCLSAIASNGTMSVCLCVCLSGDTGTAAASHAAVLSFTKRRVLRTPSARPGPPCCSTDSTGMCMPQFQLLGWGQTRPRNKKLGAYGQAGSFLVSPKGVGVSGVTESCAVLLLKQAEAVLHPSSFRPSRFAVIDTFPRTHRIEFPVFTQHVPHSYLAVIQSCVCVVQCNSFFAFPIDGAHIGKKSMNVSHPSHALDCKRSRFRARKLGLVCGLSPLRTPVFGPEIGTRK